MTEGTLIVIVILSEAFLHYFRWKQVLMGRDLPRVAAYVLGVLGLMLPYTAWLYGYGHIEAIKAIEILWKDIIAGGLAVVLCYGIDVIVDLAWDLIQSREREKVLTEQLKELHEQGK